MCGTPAQQCKIEVVVMKQKTEFVTKMKTELTEINTEIEKLSEKIEKVGKTVKAEARTQAKSRLQALRDHAAELNKQLDEAGNVTESNWADFSAAFNKSSKEMKDAFKRSRQWLSEIIAP